MTVDLKPRRSRDQMDGIRTAILDIVQDDPPMTVRQVFYQLVSRRLVDKTEKAYRETVVKVMTRMRADGTLPYDLVVDNSRWVRITQTFDNVQQAMEHAAQNYRRSALALSDVYLEIWCEKDALSAVIEPVTEEYDVPLMVSRGSPSLSFLHGSALQIQQAADDGKRFIIYQFGDHDPTGVSIPRSMLNRLTEMCDTLGCPPPTLHRAALTVPQIRRHRLPTRPTKLAGNPHAGDFQGDSVELDALPSRVLRDMVRQVIEKHVSPQATAKLRKAEDRDRKKFWVR